MTTESNNLHALNLLGADFSAALSTQRQTRRPERRWRLQLVAASASLLLLLLAVVLPRVLTDSPLQATRAAADLADTAAGIAPPPPGQFAYTDSYLIQTNSESAVPGHAAPPSSELRQRAWSSTARIGRIETTRLTPPGEGRTVSVPLRPSSTVQVGSKNFKLSGLERGSTASALIAAARASGDSAPAAAAQIRWRATIAPLEALAPVLPGATRAALIRELVSIPGVRLVSTGNGQEAYEFAADGRRNVATFSTRTATLLKTSTVIAAPGHQPFPKAPAGTILYSYQLRDIAQVKAVGQTGRPRN